MAYKDASLVAAPPSEVRVAAKKRFIAIDLLRGIAIVLMALDHVAHFTGTRMQAEFYNGAAFEIESWPHWVSGLLTNIAAPTFWVLSGVSIAFLHASGQARNATAAALTRFLWVRAFILLALDLTLINAVWHQPEDTSPVIFGVLSSIALSMLLLSVLRFLPQSRLLFVSLAMLLIYPLLVVTFPLPNNPTPWQALLLHFSPATNPTIWFPILGWWGLLGLGYCLGLSFHLPHWQHPVRWLLIGGMLLALWLIIRLGGGYGTFTPYQRGTPLINLLFMSKAPPGLDYLALNLGLSALLFAAILAFPWIGQSSFVQPLVWMGQTPLFVYVVHLMILRVLGDLTIQSAIPGLVRGYLVWIVALMPLAGLAFWYRGLRQRYPTVLRYF